MAVGIGYVMSLPTLVDFQWDLFGVAILGYGLIFSGSASLNHLQENYYDNLMDRTAKRPLPSGEVSVSFVGVFSFVMLVLGFSVLVLVFPMPVWLLAACVVGFYNYVYTPLKRVTWLNTFVGAIPGALPVLCGWAISSQPFTPLAYFLFGLYYFWQLPHFFSIAWIYKESYKNAGFKMLSLYDKTGKKSSIYSLFFCLVLAILVVLPYLCGYFHLFYLLIMGSVTVWFLWVSLKFVLDSCVVRAKKVMLVSIVFSQLLFL